jgi:hypothetical protein
MSVVHGPESPHQRMKSESAKPSSRFGSNPDPNSRDADDVRGCTRKWDFSFNYSDVARQSAGTAALMPLVFWSWSGFSE